MTCHQPSTHKRPRQITRCITGIIAALIAAGVTVPAAYAAPAAAAHPAAAAAKAHTVVTFKGSGTKRTKRFWVTSTWKLSYHFSCASFGSAGNFIVDEDNGADFNGVEVNDLAKSKTASTWAYDDKGRHYLEIISECSWSVKVIDEP